LIIESRAINMQYMEIDIVLPDKSRRILPSSLMKENTGAVIESERTRTVQYSCLIGIISERAKTRNQGMIPAFNNVQDGQVEIYVGKACYLDVHGSV